MRITFTFTLPLLLIFSLTFQTAYAQCWNLVWADEFNGTSLDPANWSFQTGGVGWGNGELQAYTNSTDNVFVTGGELHIKAIENAGSYTSGRISTQNKADFKYGKFEARVKLPEGQGLWPAFWMMPTERVLWPYYSEIDIMELLGHENAKTYTTLHYGTVTNRKLKNANYTLPVGNFHDSYHLLGLEWDVNEIRWYVDGTQIFSVNRTTISPNFWSFDQMFYIIFNVAVGGSWPGAPDATTVFPQEMIVDYVRVYQLIDDINVKGRIIAEPNMSNVSYSVSNLPGTSYTWSVPASASIVSGQGTSTILVNWGTSGGDVSATMTNACGTASAVLPVAITGNLWENYGFEQSLSRWNTRNAGTSATTYSLNTADKTGGEQSLCANVTALGANSWDIQLTRSNFSVTAGTEYKLQFWAKASGNYRITTTLYNNINNTQLISRNFDLTTSWAQYSFLYTPASDISDVKFNLDMGRSLGTYCYDDFAFGKSSLLPVELLSFTAQPDRNNPNAILLTWKTASETNNKGFELQRSQDGINFSIIAWKDGAINSSSIKNYSYQDKNVLPRQTYFYLLRQVDTDGKYAFSPIVKSQIASNKQVSKINIYPNPSKGDAALFINSPITGKLFYKVFDVYGKMLLNESEDATEGANTILLNADRLEAGIFFIHVKIGSHRFVEKWVLSEK